MLNLVLAIMLFTLACYMYKMIISDEFMVHTVRYRRGFMIIFIVIIINGIANTTKFIMEVL